MSKLTVGDLLYYADSFIHDPIGSKIVKYGRDRATDYLINKMPRPIKDAAPFSRLSKRRRTTDIPMRDLYSTAPGRYTGKIRFPKKKPKMNKSLYAIKGSRGKIEQNISAQAMTGVVYTGFSSVIRNPKTPIIRNGSITWNVAMALTRYMYKTQFGIDIENPRQTMGNTGLNDPSTGVSYPAKLVFYYKQMPMGSTDAQGNNTVPVIDKESTADLTLSNLFTYAQIAEHVAQNVLCSRNFGACGEIVIGTSPNQQRATRELYGFAFEFNDANSGTTLARQMGIRRLDNVIIKVKSNTTIFVQNATVSDGGSLSTDVIDTNPLRGRIYYFKHPNPVVRSYVGESALGSNSYKLMTDANADGAIVADASLALDWRQIPTPDMFKNVSSYGEMKLEPGEIKKFRFGFKFDGYINKFIKGLKLIDPNGVNLGDDEVTVPDSTVSFPSKYQYEIDEASGAMGTCVLFAFEKMLSTGAANPTVSFQRNTYTAAAVKKRVSQKMMPIMHDEVTFGVDDTTN